MELCLFPSEESALPHPSSQRAPPALLPHSQQRQGPHSNPQPTIVSWPLIPASLAREGRRGSPDLVPLSPQGGRAIWPPLCLASAIPGLQASSCPRAFAPAEAHSLAHPLPRCRVAPSSALGLRTASLLSPGPPLGSLLHLPELAPFLDGCGSRYATPYKVRQTVISHWKEGPAPRAGARNACCPWVTWMVVHPAAGRAFSSHGGPLSASQLPPVVP